MRRLSLFGLIAFLLCLATFARAADSNRPPNVVFILTDDQGYADLANGKLIRGLVAISP